MTRTVYRACNLCEAICGLEIEIEDRKILSIRGDDADPFSRGHICPKAVALLDVHEDPNRLRRPLKRNANEWQEISWEEAFDLAAERLAAIQLQHGNDAVGFYVGNPSVHNIGTLFNVSQLARVLKSKSAFSATSVDQLPQQLASYLMYGHQFLIPIPDIDRTDYFLILGANPVASNGSLMTAPDVTKRLAAIRGRGGKVVVIDPRRTETADVASEHHFIRPATDAALLMAMLNTMRAENLFRIANPEQLDGLDAALDAIAEMTPELAATMTGIDAQTIRRIAREFASAPSAVCYGRVGANLQAFGTLNAWLIQLVNIVTGNLDREGGAMLTDPIIPMTGPHTRRGHYAQWRSRVSGLPETAGELPVAALAEEILTPGEGQIRGLITIAGNPVLSTPNGRKLDDALESLEFMLAIDIYLNETTRHADLILPPASSLEHDHYDRIFNALAIRNVARFNAAIWPRAEEERYDWEIFGELGARLGAKLGRDFKPLPPTRDVIQSYVDKSRVSFETLENAEHGLDLGPLTPSLYERLETEDRKIHCAPEPLLADIARFNIPPTGFLLIGRRHLRSNNSWMHNSHRLIKGKARDQLMMHPEDLAALGFVDGQVVDVQAGGGSVRIAVQSTDSVMRGVVSLPHGFGHNRPGTRLGLAEQNAGVSYNDLTDDSVDAVSGNAALNGVPVTITAA
ncbi:MAG TPA: molybdopterin-dependent oxidoreductase [Thermoanaerobaculia bacterium]|jgi:anaerobic selenocysteine-containing dehydrogenase|nr:molybdopterin-dependent oxidoreductase [Thermoanaerobaculia bacterium]